MITNPVAQWLLSAVFVATFAYAAVRVVHARSARDRISYVLHALMSAAMLAMVWPWGVDLLLVPQIVLFSAAALWFVVLLATGRAPSHDVDDAHGHHDGRRALGYHAAMMGAMVFMAVGMSAMGTASPGEASASMGSMPGMDMSGGGGGGMAMPLWVVVASAVCAVGFGIAALYYLGSTLAAATAEGRASRPGRSRTATAAWNLLMAAGMAVLFVPMTGL